MWRGALAIAIDPAQGSQSIKGAVAPTRDDSQSATLRRHIVDPPRRKVGDQSDEVGRPRWRRLRRKKPVTMFESARFQFCVVRGSLACSCYGFFGLVV